MRKSAARSVSIILRKTSVNGLVSHPRTVYIRGGPTRSRALVEFILVCIQNKFNGNFHTNGVGVSGHLLPEPLMHKLLDSGFH